jgi:hypothetical protein
VQTVGGASEEVIVYATTKRVIPAAGLDLS